MSRSADILKKLNEGSAVFSKLRRAVKELQKLQDKAERYKLTTDEEKDNVIAVLLGKGRFILDIAQKNNLYGLDSYNIFKEPEEFTPEEQLAYEIDGVIDRNVSVMQRIAGGAMKLELSQKRILGRL